MEEEITFDQISYLPKKGIYLASSSNWEITTLNKDFEILDKVDAEDGTFFPMVDENENLISFWSYDQNSFFDLYKMGKENDIKFIHTFFENSDSISKSFAFIGEEILVAYPKKIELFKVQENDVVKIQELNIEAYKSTYDTCSLATVSKELFLLGKGYQLIVYQKSDKIRKIEEMDLDLAAEIVQIHFDKEKRSLIVMTNVAIKCIHLKEKDWAQ